MSFESQRQRQSLAALVVAVLFVSVGPGRLAAQVNQQRYLTFNRFAPGRTSPPCAVTPNQNSPSWWQIETAGQPLDYKLYQSGAPNNCDSSTHNCEMLGMTGTSAYTPYGFLQVRPPAATYFVTSTAAPTATGSGGCGVVDAPASMFTVATPYSNARGMVWQGYLGGGSGAYSSPSNAWSYAAMYVSSNECAAGNQEYGFFADTTKSQNGSISGQYWVFYYSTNTNTSSQSTSAPGNSGVISNITITSGSGIEYFSMYIIPASASPTQPTSDTGYDFRIQVLNSDYTFAKCAIGLGNSTLQDCTLDIPISQMVDVNGFPNGQQWPVGPGGTMPGSSYLTVASQTSAATNSKGTGVVPSYTCPTCANGFWTNGVWLGF